MTVIQYTCWAPNRENLGLFIGVLTGHCKLNLSVLQDKGKLMYIMRGEVE